MTVSELMSRDVQVVGPDQSLQEAAALMARIDSGFLPVGERDRLVGTLTDRDVTIRAVAQGKGPDCAVRSVMTEDVKYCFEDQELDEVLDNMGQEQIRRLPVVDRDKRLVGVLSLGDAAARRGGAEVGEALEEISQPVRADR